MTEHTTKQAYSGPVIRALSYIEEQLFEALDLQQVAAAAGYSKYHLHRIFSRETGMSPHRYIRRRKLTEAARLLVFSEQPIMDIALAAGYESRQAFTGIFKEMYKKTPARYRREGIFYPLQLNCMPLHMFAGARERGRTMEPEEKIGSLGAPGAPGERIGTCQPEKIRPALERDIPQWMELVHLVIDGYPCLQEEHYRENLRRDIRRGRALILEGNGGAAGVMLLDETRGWIDFLGIHPRLRETGIQEAFLEKAFSRLSAGHALTITTFRRGDKADTGHRRLLERLGFEEAEELVEFGYPTQKMILSEGTLGKGRSREAGAGRGEGEKDE